jgi:hypothetical protein
MRNPGTQGLWFLLLTALVLASSTMGSAQNIVANYNFTGTAPWATTQTSDNYPWGWGDGFASTGCVGSSCITGGPGQLADLFQDLTTVDGATYTLSFLYNSGSGATTELEALFGSTVAIDLVNQDGSYVTYNIPGLVATSSTTVLDFLGRQDPGFNYLTDVSVVETAPPSVPEGGVSLLYLLLAAAACFGAMLVSSRIRPRNYASA